MSRPDGRTPLQLRPVSLEVGVVPHAEGSCLITQGRTKVPIAATLEQ
nr:ribonuclease PH [Thermoanaerobaculia bacterium]